MRCPFCGSHLDNNAKYCNDCGTAVDSECAGKNINYRSYTDTRPNSAAAPKTPYHRVKENNYIPKTAVNPTPVTPSDTEKKNPFLGNVQKTPAPNFTAGQFGQFKGTTAKNGKKSGCGIIVIIIMSIFAITSIIGAIFGEEENNNNDYDNDNNNYYYNQEWDNGQDDDSGNGNEIQYGRFDGSYYLNDWVNFALKVPEEFDESSWFSLTNDMDINADYYFKNEDGDFILTGFAKGDDPFVFLNEYINSVNENMTDTNLKTEISNLGEKQVYNNDFITQSVSREDGRIADVYVCPVDDWIFFVEVNTSSADLNNQIADTFVNSYSN